MDAALNNSGIQELRESPIRTPRDPETHRLTDSEMQKLTNSQTISNWYELDQTNSKWLKLEKLLLTGSH